MARRQFRAQKRFTRWTGVSSGGSFLAQGAGSVALTIVGSITATETLIRVRGELVGWLDGASAPSKAVLLSVGWIVMPEGQGATVVSEPFGDANAPWLLYERGLLGYEEMVVDTVSVQGLPFFRKTIDSKAMRILRPDREVQMVVTNTTIDAAGSTNLVVVVV